MDADEKKLMTPAEVASLANVSLKAVYRWVERGWLPYVGTPGGKYRFRRETVEALLAERVKEQPASIRPKHRAGGKKAAQAKAREERTRQLLGQAGQKS